MFRLASYNPSNLTNKRSDIDPIFDLMDNFFGDYPTSGLMNGFKVDIRDTENSYLLEADLPGVKKEDIVVDYNDDELTIKVETKSETNEEKDNYIRRERLCKSMKRVFLVKDINVGEISAKYEDGVLTVVAPKMIKDEKSYKIDVQ